MELNAQVSFSCYVELSCQSQHLYSNIFNDAVSTTDVTIQRGHMVMTDGE